MKDRPIRPTRRCFILSAAAAFVIEEVGEGDRRTSATFAETTDLSNGRATLGRRAPVEAEV